MKKIYQPEVLKMTDNFINELKSIDFFEDEGITDLEYTKEHLCDFMTEKFINGEFDGEGVNITEDEFDSLLTNIIVGSTLYSLKNKGLLNSYSDDETEELFFLTDKGRDFIKEQTGE